MNFSGMKNLNLSKSVLSLFCLIKRQLKSFFIRFEMAPDIEASRILTLTRYKMYVWTCEN